MSRELFYSYRDEDATEAFNTRLRGALLSGVYGGFTVSSGGSGGLWLKFTHDTDPDDGTGLLGVIVTHDGVTIQENADQDDVVQGSVVAGTPNIHYVVASYVYNKALPANDVSYVVKQGTSAVPPVPPALTDDEVLIAKIYVPTGAVAYTDPGVIIENVARKNLYDINSYNLFSKFANILEPGIYEGLEMSVGSNPLDITLTAGTFITNENIKIVEAVNQVDIVTQTNPGAGSYRFSWLVAMHINYDSNPEPDVNYILVEGTPAVVGTEATVPSNADILVVAAAVDERYLGATYINKIGLIRCENRGGSYIINYYKGTSILDQNTITVFGAQSTSENRSGLYYGHEGLKNAIDAVYAITQIREYLDVPYSIEIDGQINLADVPLYIPSNIKLVGRGAGAEILSENNDVINAVGWSVDYNAVNDVVDTTGVWAGDVRAGFDRVAVVIEAVYRVGDDLVDYKFSRGDQIILHDSGAGTMYMGTVYEYDTGVDNWTLNCYIDSQYGFDGSPEDVDVLILKHNIGLENLYVGPIDSADGTINLKYVKDAKLNNVSMGDLDFSVVMDSVFENIVVRGDSSFAGTFGIAANKVTNSNGNFYNNIEFRGTTSPAVLFDDDVGSKATVIKYNNSMIAMNLTIAGVMDIDSISVIGAAGSITTISGTGMIGSVVGDDVEITSTGGVIIGFIENNLTLNAGANHNVIKFVAGTSTDSSGEVHNRIYHSLSSDIANEFLEHANSDRNMKLYSTGSLYWDSTLGLLSWDDDLYIDIPYETGVNKILAGSATLAVDGDRAYVILDRDAVAISVVTISIKTKAASNDLRRNKDVFMVAIRRDNVIYLWDGTRIENEQSVKVGSTPPPDSSVTYVKLAPTATAFHNQVFRDYVSPVNSEGWDDSVLLLLDGIITYGYTAATGIIQYSAPVDLSGVQPGDMVILRQTSFNPGVAGSGAFTFEEIFEVDDVLDNVRIAIGLDPTVGAANRWNGAIVRGNKVISNDDGTGTPIAYTYDSANGRVTYANTLGFNDIMVRPGMVWLDSALKKWRITGVDPAGQYVDIDVRRRDVAATPPTSILQGSIEKNNNPYDLPMSDLSCIAGMEFVPIDGFGKIEVKEDYLVRGQGNLGVSNDLATLDRRYSEPYDPRIRLRMTPLNRPVYESFVNDYTTHNKLHIGNSGIAFVELTAICTGAVLVIAGDLAAATTAFHPLVDGVGNAVIVGGINDLATDSVVYTNTYGNEVGRYEIMAGSNGACQVMEGIRMPVGVHHFMWPIASDWQVRGVLIIKHPGYDGTLGAVVSDSPGQYVSQGEVLTKESLTRSTAIPVDPHVPATGWDKGSRMVRYLDKDGVYSFASTFIENFVDVGNIAGGVAITGTSNNKWKVGDIVMAFDGAGVKNLRRISSIVGTTLNTWGNPWTFVDPIAKLYYYGSTYDSAHDRRDYEEIIAQYSVLDFAVPEGNGISDSRSTAFRAGTARGGTTPIGIRLTDLSTGLKGSDTLDHEAGGAIQLDAASDEIQIRFVGSGLSVNRESTGTSTIYIDDVEVYCFPATTLLDMDDDPGGTFICGNLPYGQHIVRILRTAGAFLLNAITVWGPKKPATPFADLPALELLDTNVLAAPVSSYGIDPVDGPDEIQFGTIQLEVGRFYHPITHSSPLEDKPDTVITQSTHARTMGYDGVSAPHTVDAISIPFFGTEITLVTKTITLGGATFPVTVMDHDGAFKAPSALTGFVVTGVDTLAADATNGHRNRWVFSELAFHILQLNVGGVPGAPGADVLDIDSVEIHTPFHVYKTKQPVAIDHFIPFQFGGFDVRNLTPFRAEWLPGTDKAHCQSAQFHSSAVEWINQRPFVFYSRGGLIEIHATFMATDNSTTVSVKMVIDGIDDGFAINQDVPIAADSAAINLIRTVYLSPGFHIAYLAMALSGGNYTVGRVNWVAKSITHQSTHIASRGFGVPLLGPAGSSESSF